MATLKQLAHGLRVFINQYDSLIVTHFHPVNPVLPLGTSGEHLVTQV